LCHQGGALLCHREGVPLCVTLLSNTRNHFPFLTGIHFSFPFFLLTQINIIFEFERKKAPSRNTPRSHIDGLYAHPSFTHPLTNRLLIALLILTFFAFLREKQPKTVIPGIQTIHQYTLSSVSHKYRPPTNTDPYSFTFWSPSTRQKKTVTQQSTLLSLLPPVHLSLLSSSRSIFLLLLPSPDHTKYSHLKSNTPCLRD
jgi:hypothetical protein